MQLADLDPQIDAVVLAAHSRGRRDGLDVAEDVRARQEPVRHVPPELELGEDSVEEERVRPRVLSVVEPVGNLF